MKRNMRRMLILGGLLGLAFVMARVFSADARERLMARCESMFDQMPDTFPPKRMMRALEETRANTARILELLEPRDDEAHPSDANSAAASREPVASH
jgi:hypothetical protein